MDPNDELPPNLGSTIGFIGSLIVTLGYVIVTLGEGVDLAQVKQDESKASGGKVDQNKQFAQIQKKLDYMMKEIKELKRRG